jgi:hypothetical protein
MLTLEERRIHFISYHPIGSSKSLGSLWSLPTNLQTEVVLHVRRKSDFSVPLNNRSILPFLP